MWTGVGGVRIFLLGFSAGEIPFLPNIPSRIASERFLSSFSTDDRYKKPMHYKIQKLSMVNDDASDDLIKANDNSESSR